MPESFNRLSRGNVKNRVNSASNLKSDSMTRKHRPDYPLLILALLLSVLGLVVVYSISPGLAATRGVSNNYFIIKQSISILLGLAAFSVFSFMKIEQVKALQKVLIGLCVISVVLVWLIGEEVNGASRWIQVGGLSFQVAELIKFSLIIWLASFLVERVRQGEIGDVKKTLRPLLIVLGVLGVIVGYIQSDLGSTGVMMAIMAIMAFVAGLPLKRIGLIGIIVIIGTFALIAPSEYRRGRVATFLNPTSDCQNTGYQACQALIAVGSGGVFGLGLGNGVQAFGYLPEAANDSIFAILAEKFGFLGVSVVLGIYGAFFYRLKRIIDRTADPFSRLFVTGVLAWLSVQTIINVGAMIGLLPLKGITLPFISYGGTSILFIMAAIGVVFQISRYTNFEPIRRVKIEGQSYDNRSVRGRVSRPYHATNRGR